MGYKKFMYTVFKLLVGADKAALLRNVTTQLMHLEYQFVIVRKRYCIPYNLVPRVLY